VEHFLKEGGDLPATPSQVEAYLKKCAERYNSRTLVRRMTALRQWHRLKAEKDPTADPLVVKTLRGIARLHGRPRKQASALRLQELDQVVQHLDHDETLIHRRNRALLLVGFFGAFRRSELVSLTWEQIEFVSDGMIITLPRSKTDQVGEGAKCIIPFGNESRSPVRALIAWRKASNVWAGPIFRRISKTGTIHSRGITSKHLNHMIKQLAKEVGLPNAEGYSSHSLRRGFATESARLGASMPAIQRHGRWRSTKTVIEYIEAGRQFADSAVNVLFEF
jgi:integrase